MIVSEAQRRVMQDRLLETLGTEAADILMEYLPPVGWADVATKRDLDALELSLRGEISGLRGELRGQIGRLDGKIEALGAQLRQEINRQQRAMYLGTVATILSTFGAMGGRAALLH